MTLKELAPILISLLSLTIAMFSLGWNVYRDIILKPRVRVTVKRGVTNAGGQMSGPQYFITAVNFGPGKVHLKMIWFRNASLFQRLMRRAAQGILVYDYRNPLSAKLPLTLEVGESADFPFAWNEKAIFSRAPTHFGLIDSYGRYHWAKGAALQLLNAEWQREFPPERRNA